MLRALTFLACLLLIGFVLGWCPSASAAPKCLENEPAKSIQSSSRDTSGVWNKEELTRLNRTARQTLTGEAIRQAIIAYLINIQNKKEPGGAEKSVKSVLATDARIAKIRTCKINFDDDDAYINGWSCSTATGKVEIHLTSEYAVIAFFGTLTKEQSGKYAVSITRVLHGKRDTRPKE